DRDKKEFLADVSSCANASGADLIYGVAATDGVPTEARGLVGLNVDAEMLRLEKLIPGGGEAPIPRFPISSVAGFPDGPVLIVRVPKSWASPHMVVFQNTSRFYTRNNAGKHQLDVAEIRAAFSISESVTERVQNFRADRLSKVVSDEGPVRL